MANSSLTDKICQLATAQNKRGTETQGAMATSNGFSLLQICRSSQSAPSTTPPSTAPPSTPPPSKSPPSKSPPQRLTKFHKFPKLPTELRLLVWEWAVRSLKGRIVALNIISDVNSGQPRITCQKPHPSIASTCREARVVTLETLGLFLPASTWHNLVSADIEKDTVILGTSWGRNHVKQFVEAVGADKAKKLKHLGIEFERALETIESAVILGTLTYHPRYILREDFEVYDLPACFRGLRDMYDAFPALDTLKFIAHHDGDTRERDGSHRLVGELVFEESYYQTHYDVEDSLNSSRLVARQRHTYAGWAAEQVEILWCDLAEADLYSANGNNYIPPQSVEVMIPQIDFVQLGVKPSKTACPHRSSKKRRGRGGRKRGGRK